MEEVAFEEVSFERVSVTLRQYIRCVFDQDVPIIPFSSALGDNIVQRSEKMQWWSGVDVLSPIGEMCKVTTLLDMLNALLVPTQDCCAEHGPVRNEMLVSVSGVYKVKGLGRVITGQVRQGMLRPGVDVVFMPSESAGVVTQIVVNTVPVEHACPGTSIAVKILENNKEFHMRSGDVMMCRNSTPIAKVKRVVIEANAFGYLETGCETLARFKLGRCECCIKHLVWVKKHNATEHLPTVISPLQRALFVVELRMPLFVSTSFATLASIALEDPSSHDVVAVGEVMHPEVLRRCRRGCIQMALHPLLASSHIRQHIAEYTTGGAEGMLIP